jgi:hypothetical protein
MKQMSVLVRCLPDKVKVSQARCVVQLVSINVRKTSWRPGSLYSKVISILSIRWHQTWITWNRLHLASHYTLTTNLSAFVVQGIALTATFSVFPFVFMTWSRDREGASADHFNCNFPPPPHLLQLTLLSAQISFPTSCFKTQSSWDVIRPVDFVASIFQSV